MRRVIENPIAGALAAIAGISLLAALVLNPANDTFADSSWISTVIPDLGISIDRPGSASATYYPVEKTLHVELLPGPVVLSLRLFENPEKLSSAAWADQYLLDPALRGSSPLAPPLPTSERDEFFLAGSTADRFSVHGPVKTIRRTVVARGDSAFILDHELQDGEIGDLLDQIVASLRFEDYEDAQGYDLPTGGLASDITELPVPLYSQLDPRWICDQIGSCWCYLGNCWGHTGIGDAGCYIAAESMIFDYYTGGFMDPLELDTCLTENGGYGLWQGCGWGLCATTYDPISACTPAEVSYEGLASDRSLLDEDLQNGFPVIAWVDGGVHYLVITGKQDGLYLVNDPLYARTSIYSGEIIYYVRLHGTPAPEPGVDPHLQSGFPAPAYRSQGTQFADAFQYVLIANLDSDHQQEIASTGLGFGPLYVWEPDGALSEGWPQGVSSGQAFPAAGKLTGSSQGLSMAAGYGGGEIRGYQAAGATLPGWPALISSGGAPPSLADVDGDGLEEIFIPTGDGKIEAFHSDGTKLPGWPVQGGAGSNFSTPAIADLDEDGDLEVVALSGPVSGGLSLYGFSAAGGALSGFPISVAGTRATVPVVGDVDGDTHNEIVVAGAEASVQVYSAGGQLERTILPDGPFTRSTAPALADLDGDGLPEIVVQADQSLNVWDGFGASLPGWPESWGADYLSGKSSPVVGDVDGDGLPDIAIALQSASMDGTGQLRVYDRNASVLPGGMKTIPSGPGAVPGISDIDLDGRNEIILVGTAEAQEAGFADKVWVFDLGGGDHGPVEWGQFGGGPQHRGVYPVPPPPQPSNLPPVDQGDVYLPLVRMKASSPPAAIHGKLTLNGQGAAGIPVTLRYFDGEDWIDWISLASGPGGSFYYQAPPGLGLDEKYLVRFTNASDSPDLVSQWESRAITNYHPGGAAATTAVDLVDLILTAPDPSATRPFPVTFSWTRNSSSPEFLYRLIIYDPLDATPFFQSPLVEVQQQYTLDSLPVGFAYNQSYTWTVWIYSPDGSQLLSRQSRPITFIPAQN
jgi:hypothetical protein